MADTISTGWTCKNAQQLRNSIEKDWTVPMCSEEGYKECSKKKVCVESGSKHDYKKCHKRTTEVGKTHMTSYPGGPEDRPK